MDYLRSLAGRKDALEKGSIYVVPTRMILHRRKQHKTRRHWMAGTAPTMSAKMTHGRYERDDERPNIAGCLARGCLKIDDAGKAPIGARTTQPIQSLFCFRIEHWSLEVGRMPA